MTDPRQELYLITAGMQCYGILKDRRIADVCSARQRQSRERLCAERCICCMKSATHPQLSRGYDETQRLCFTDNSIIWGCRCVYSGIGTQSARVIGYGCGDCPGRHRDGRCTNYLWPLA